MASEAGAVVFQVAMDPTKPQIKEAVEAIFGVKVKAVNTTITKGKAKKFRGRAGERRTRRRPMSCWKTVNTIDVSTGL
jgi:large subunit ribosomal protein L23